jgi:hypothetical protein
VAWRQDELIGGKPPVVKKIWLLILLWKVSDREPQELGAETNWLAVNRQS